MPGGSSFRTSWIPSATNGAATKQVTATNTYARAGTRLILALPAWKPSLRPADYDEGSVSYQRKVQRVLILLARPDLAGYGLRDPGVQAHPICFRPTLDVAMELLR